jgi:hypothetical protein
LNFLCLRDYPKTQALKTPFCLGFQPLQDHSLSTPFTMSDIASQLKELEEQRKSLLANAAKEHAELIKKAEILAALLGMTGGSAASNANQPAAPPRAQVATNVSAWVNRQPTASAASAATVAAPVGVRNMSAVAVTDIDPNSPKLSELADELHEKVCQATIAEEYLYLKMNPQHTNLGLTLKRLVKVLGLDEHFKKHLEDGRVCYVPMRLVRKVLVAACRKGAAVPTDEAMCKAAEFFFAACICWNPVKESTTLESFKLPKGYAKKMGVIQFNMNTHTGAIAKSLVPTTEDSIQDVLDQLDGVPPISDYRPKVYYNSSTRSGSGNGGGGATLTKQLNGSRSVKQGQAAATGPSFQTSDKLYELIKKHIKTTVGVPPSGVAKHLRDVMQANNLVFYEDGLVQASNGSTLTPEKIEKILCVVFSLQTTAQIADAERANAAAKFAAADQAKPRGVNTNSGGYAALAGDDQAADGNDQTTDGNDQTAGGGASPGTEADLVDTATLPKNIIEMLKQAGSKSADALKGIYATITEQFKIVFDDYEYQNIDGTEITNINAINKAIVVLAAEVIFE